MRLYFFPALLPLAPLLPIVLTVLGAIAAGLRALKRKPVWAWTAGILFAAAIGTFAYQKVRLPSSSDGSHLTPADQLPQPQPLAAHDAEAEQASPREATPGPLTEAWYHLSDRRALSATLVAPDWIIVGTYEGEVRAVSTRTGEYAWSLRKHEPVLSPAAVLGGDVFVGEGLHTAQSSALTAIDLGSGRVRWQREFLGHVERAPAVDEKRGRLYAVTGPQGVWALNAQDGAVIWHARIGHADTTPLLLNATSLWVMIQPSPASPDSLLAELDPEGGKGQFEQKLPGQPWGEPQHEGDQILVTTGVGQIGEASAGDRGWSHAFSLKTRQLAWTTPLETMPVPRSVVSGSLGLVFHALKSGKAVALSLADGHVAWTFDLGSPCLAPPALVGTGGNTVAYLPTGGDLVLLDAHTGKLTARTPAGANATAGPLYDGAQRIFTIAGDSLSAFDLSTP